MVGFRSLSLLASKYHAREQDNDARLIVLHARSRRPRARPARPTLRPNRMPRVWRKPGRLKLFPRARLITQRRCKRGIGAFPAFGRKHSSSLIPRSRDTLGPLARALTAENLRDSAPSGGIPRTHPRRGKDSRRAQHDLQLTPPHAADATPVDRYVTDDPVAPDGLSITVIRAAKKAGSVFGLEIEDDRSLNFDRMAVDHVWAVTPPLHRVQG